MSQANVFVKVGGDGSIENIAMQKSEDIDIDAVWDGMPEGWPEVNAFKTYTSKSDKKLHIYFAKDAYEAMIKDSKYTENKELLTIPGAVHTDLYDNLKVIPFDKMQQFLKGNGVG